MVYHIHPVTGTPALCRAEKGHCPFGAHQEHYASKELARGAFEEQMKDELLSTHKHDPELAKSVRELFDYHIQNSDDPDVKSLLEYTKEELATADSVVKLNRISALYYSAANDLDDDENTAEASDMVGVVAETLREHYRGFRTGLINKDLLEDEEGYVAPRRELTKQTLEKERQRNLNNKLINSLTESGLVKTEGYQVAIVRSDESEETLGEFIRNTPNDAVFYGTTGIAKNDEARKIVEANGNALVKAFTVDGEFSAPLQMSRDTKRLPEGFVYLAAGAESNVYLHEATGTVYKIPHREAITKDRFAGGNEEDKERNSLNAVVFNAEAAYKLIDRKTLAKDYGAEYLTTYFLSLNDESGKSVGIIVQPYLDGERYMDYSLTNEERYDPQVAGVNDIHGGNVRLDRKTGKLVLFDCLFHNAF